MTKQEAITFFGSQAKLAEALTNAGHKLSQATISEWLEAPPLRRQIQIEVVTNGQLKADLTEEQRAVLGNRRRRAEVRA